MTHDEWVLGFWKRVARMGSQQCWLWTGHRLPSGYGQLKRKDGKTNVYAHRASVEIRRGIPLPRELTVMHTCDNPPCVNPHHLRVGTQRDNVLDMHAKDRASKTVLRGDEHGSTKVSDVDVMRIRRLYANRHTNYVTQARLAAMFGITQAQVSRIISGKRRK